jgi:hypothetical protein
LYEAAVPIAAAIDWGAGAAAVVDEVFVDEVAGAGAGAAAAVYGFVEEMEGFVTDIVVACCGLEAEALLIRPELDGADVATGCAARVGLLEVAGAFAGTSPAALVPPKNDLATAKTCSRESC